MANLKRSPSLNYERLMAFIAAADLSKKAYHFVQIGAKGEVNTVSTAGATVHGVLINPSVKGGTCGVLTEYGQRVELQIGTTSVAIPAGTRLKVAADGTALPHTGSDDEDDLHHAIVVGDGISGTTAKAGIFVDALFIPNTSGT